MKNRFQLLVAILFLLSGTKSFAQYLPSDTSESPPNLPINVAKVSSFEDVDWDESTTIPIWIKSVQDVNFKGYFKLKDNPWFQLDGSDSLAIDSVMTINDSFVVQWNFNYDTTALPFYPKEVQVDFIPDSSVHDSMRGERMKFKFMVFFTPYRTIEIWNLSDFNSIQRVWLFGDEDSVQWSYLNPDSIPISNIPADTVLSDTSTFEFMPLYKDGLPYIIPMRPTPEFIASSATAAHKADNCGLTRRRYYFKVDNIRVETSHTRDRHHNDVPIYVKNATVHFYLSGLVPRKIGRYKTDDEGYMVNSVGSRTFTVDFCASALGGAKRIYSLLKLHWPGDMNKLRLKYAGDWNNYKSYGGRGQEVSGSQSNPTVLTMFQNNTWKFPVDHATKTYTFINWAYDLTNQALEGTGEQLNKNLAIKIETTWDWGKKSNYYNHFSNTLHYKEDKLYDEASHFHEFGHYVMDQLLGTPWWSWGGHGDDANNKNFEQTLSEGFADGFSYIMDEMTFAFLDQESGFDRPAGDLKFHEPILFEDRLTTPYLSESYFGRVLLDLWDGPNNLSEFNVITDQKIEDDKNDYFEASLKDILCPLYENKKGLKTIVDYYEKFKNGITDCEEIADYLRVWQYNMENVTTTGEGAVDPSTFQFLNTDCIRGDSEKMEYVPCKKKKNGDYTAKDPISFFYHPNVSEINNSTGSFNFGINDAITDKLVVEDETLFINNSTEGCDWVIKNKPSPILSTIVVDICAPLDINNSGTIEIGDATQSAHVTISKKLVLNGDLIINNNSTLVLTSSSVCDYNIGASITLNGNAVLEIQGQLNLANSATFTFSGSGKIIINGAISDNVKFAPGSSIEIIGNGSSHVAVEVLQNDFYAFKGVNGSSTNNIHFEDCTILLGDNTRFATDFGIEMTSVVVDRATSEDNPRGFEFYGQDDVDIAGCTFNYCKYGIKSNSNIGGHSLTIKNSTFTNCETGLYTIGAGVKLSSSNFNNNDNNGWTGRGMYFESNLTFSNFNNNGSRGIQHDGKHIAGIKFYDVNVNDNGWLGASSDCFTFKSGCSNFQNNTTYGIRFRGNVMNLTSDKVKNTSRNQIDGNKYSIGFQGYSLYLNNGRNNLELDLSGIYNIQGKIWQYHDLSGGIKHNPILCDDNIFDGLTATNPGNCFVHNVPMFVGGVVTMATVTGTSLVGPIGNCDFIEVDDPWNRNHSKSLSNYPGRTAPVLLFDNPSHEFHAETLDDAVEETIEHFYDEMVSNTSVLTINRAADIITYDFETALDGHSLTLYYDAYNILMEAAQRGVESGEIVCNPDSAIPIPIQTIIAAQDYLLDEINANYTTDLYQSKYTTTLNKAMIYRLARHHDEAINELYNMQSWITTDEEVEVDFITCHTQYELDIMDSVINIYDTDLDSIYTCVDTISGGGSSRPIRTGYLDALSDDNVNSIKVFPNPSKGLSTIELLNDEGENQNAYSIYTVSGKLVKTGRIIFDSESQGQLDYQELPQGIYILKMNVGNNEHQVKLVRE